VIEDHSGEASSEPAATASANTASTAKEDPSQPASAETTTQPPRLSKAVRPNARDLSSSIVSNLASARGIPSNRPKRSAPISPLVSNHHVDGQFGFEETGAKPISRESSSGVGDNVLAVSKQTTTRPPWAPPVTIEPSKPEEGNFNGPEPSDAPFQQFYNAFESLITKLSAPLAFAGLPLTTPTSPKPAHSTAQSSPKATKTAARSAEPIPTIDYSQLISRAALRAVHSGNVGATNPSESFYVVPTTGGMTSYAEIMSRTDREESRALRHHRQTSTLSNISEDDFVDAHSTILPDRSRGSARFGRRGAGEAKVNGKTMEELALENEALKRISDTLAKRLHVFEMSAQTSSAALAQSIRSLQRSPLTTPLMSPENSRGRTSRKTEGDTEGMAKRIAELEEILRKNDAKRRQKEEENVKLRETIMKYREKWETLKAGAKARREKEKAVRNTSDGGGPSGPGTEGTEDTEPRDGEEDAPSRANG